MIADPGRAVRVALVAGLVLMGVGAVLVGTAHVVDAVRYDPDAGRGSPSGGVVRQYLLPADVTQEDAGTCSVEVREGGKGHVVCFAPGEKSRFRPYVRESVTGVGETWSVR